MAQLLLIIFLSMTGFAQIEAPQIIKVNGQQLVFSGDQLIEYKALFPDDKFSSKGATPIDVSLWEDGVLPIEFNKNISPAERDFFMQSCSRWEKLANVRCILGSYKNRSLKVSKNHFFTNGCWSMIGMDVYYLGIKRKMNLASGCWSPQTLTHEIGHAFGLTHEHQRPDRDEYIQINVENISDPFLGLNKKLNFSTQEVELHSPYDFLSIMHYRAFTFTKNGLVTIQPREPYKEFLYQMGYQVKPSKLDAQSMQLLYGPVEES